MKLKDLKDILLLSVVIVTTDDIGDEVILYDSEDFELDIIPEQLLERQVDYIYSHYNKEEERHYTIVVLGY